MNCEFCNNPLDFSHKENEDQEDKNKFTGVYDCRNCPVLTSFYFSNETGERLKTSFMLDRKEKVYIWTNNYTKGISYITDVGATLSSAMDRDPLVVKFPKIMKINPTNVHEKFSFYMVFL